MSKEAQKLSDKEIRQTLGGIDKKRKVKLFRNSLAFPYITTWPAVNLADAEELINLLVKLLPEAKICYTKPLWKDISKLSKEERKEKTKENKQTKIEEKNVVNRSFILPGYSAVTRGLEKGTVCCCILAKEVEPPVLIKNLVSLAQNKKVPVVIIPRLKSILMNSINFSAMAIGLNVVVAKEPNCIFHPIFKCVVELDKKFPVLEESRLQTHYTNIDSDVASQNFSSKNVEATNTKINYHLFISSPNGPRVFLPPRKVIESGNNSLNSLEFIRIGEDEPTKNINTGAKREVNYSTVKKDENNDDDDDIDDIDCDVTFQIDTNPDNLLKKHWEEATVERIRKKRKKIKRLTPVYQPTKIKVSKSSPTKPFKKKKRKKDINI